MFIANYIKGREAYTTYINHTSIQRQFQTGVPQGDVLSPTLFNLNTADLPPPRSSVQVMAYADDITITSTHTSTSAANKYIQPYLHKVFVWTNITVSHSIQTKQLALQTLQNIRAILSSKYTTLHYPWQRTQNSGSHLRPKLTYSTHIHNISVHAHNHLQIIKQHDGVHRRRHSWLPTRQS